MVDLSNHPVVIVIADDPLARVGLLGLVESQRFPVLAAVSPLNLSGMDEADVLLWDADPDLDADAVSQQETPVLALVGAGVDINPLLAAGAAGVLYRTATAAQIAAGLNAVAAGLNVLEPTLLSLPPASEVGSTPEDLTPRELEVLDLVSEGLANKAIAKRLGISASTVKFHVNSLLGKFGAKTRTELAVRAVHQGQTYL